MIFNLLKLTACTGAIVVVTAVTAPAQAEIVSLTTPLSDAVHATMTEAATASTVVVATVAAKASMAAKDQPQFSNHIAAPLEKTNVSFVDDVSRNLTSVETRNVLLVLGAIITPSAAVALFSIKFSILLLMFAMTAGGLMLGHFHTKAQSLKSRA